MLKLPNTEGTYSYVAVFCNLVLIVSTCWAAIAQYPYLEGNSVIPFALLMAFTSAISLVAFFRSGKVRGKDKQRIVAHF
jgi:hypothetical protein